MAHSTILDNSRRFESRRFVGRFATWSFAIAAIVFTVSRLFAQVENPRGPSGAAVPPSVTPVIHYELRQVAAQEPAARPPAGNAANEVIPLPPSEDQMLGAPITSLTTDIRIKETPGIRSDVPPSDVSARLRRQGEMSYVMHRPGAGAICYMWDAPAICSNPLYFEDTNLERHGYSLRYLRMFQPVVSGAEFFVTVPTLPYQLAATPPWEPVYTLGEYRPGSCVPYQLNYPPLSAPGGLAEAGTAVELIFLIP